MYFFLLSHWNLDTHSAPVSIWSVFTHLTPCILSTHMMLMRMYVRTKQYAIIRMQSHENGLIWTEFVVFFLVKLAIIWLFLHFIMRLRYAMWRNARAFGSKGEIPYFFFHTCEVIIEYICNCCVLFDVRVHVNSPPGSSRKFYGSIDINSSFINE